MTETPSANIYESTFAKSDKTDAILVVQGKKLHVNKAFLSFHSDYFNTLFNCDFKEKTMPEIEIKDVDFKDFAAFLSLTLQKPILPTEENVEKLLEFAERFLLPAAKRHLELFIITTQIPSNKKLELADKYELDVLLKHALSLYTTIDEISQLGKNFGLSDGTKARIFERYYEMYCDATEAKAKPPQPTAFRFSSTSTRY